MASSRPTSPRSEVSGEKPSPPRSKQEKKLKRSFTVQIKTTGNDDISPQRQRRSSMASLRIKRRSPRAARKPGDRLHSPTAAIIRNRARNSRTDVSSRSTKASVIKVMVSYCRRNKPFVQKLVASLEKQGFGVWVDWKRIPGGVDWWKEIEKGILDCSVFVFCLSPEAIESKVCNQEVDYALECGKRIVPIVVKDGFKWDKVRAEIARINFIFFTGDNEYTERYKQLVSVIKINPEHVSTHTELQRQAMNWEANECAPELLLRGVALVHASNWILEAQTNYTNPEPTDLQCRFIMNAHLEEAMARRKSMVLHQLMHFGDQSPAFGEALPQANARESNSSRGAGGVDKAALNATNSSTSPPPAVTSRSERSERKKQVVFDLTSEVGNNTPRRSEGTASDIRTSDIALQVSRRRSQEDSKSVMSESTEIRSSEETALPRGSSLFQLRGRLQAFTSTESYMQKLLVYIMLHILVAILVPLLACQPTTIVTTVIAGFSLALSSIALLELLFELFIYQEAFICSSTFVADFVVVSARLVLEVLYFSGWQSALSKQLFAFTLLRFCRVFGILHTKYKSMLGEKNQDAALLVETTGEAFRLRRMIRDLKYKNKQLQKKLKRAKSGRKGKSQSNIVTHQGTLEGSMKIKSRGLMGTFLWAERFFILDRRSPEHPTLTFYKSSADAIVNSQGEAKIDFATVQGIKVKKSNRKKLLIVISRRDDAPFEITAKTEAEASEWSKAMREVLDEMRRKEEETHSMAEKSYNMIKSTLVPEEVKKIKEKKVMSKKETISIIESMHSKNEKRRAARDRAATYAAPPLERKSEEKDTQATRGRAATSIKRSSTKTTPATSPAAMMTLGESAAFNIGKSNTTAPKNSNSSDPMGMVSPLRRYVTSEQNPTVSSFRVSSATEATSSSRLANSPHANAAAKNPIKGKKIDAVD